MLLWNRIQVMFNTTHNDAIFVLFHLGCCLDGAIYVLYLQGEIVLDLFATGITSVFSDEISRLEF